MKRTPFRGALFIFQDIHNPRFVTYYIVEKGDGAMYRRTPKGSLAIAFGLGLIVASCCSSSAVVFILAIMIIILGLMSMRNC